MHPFTTDSLEARSLCKAKYLVMCDARILASVEDWYISAADLCNNYVFDDKSIKLGIAMHHKVFENFG